MRTSRRLLMFALTAALPLAVVTPAAAVPGKSGPTPPSWLKVENGVSVPQFDLANAVEETLFVQTTVDSDLDGVKDRVRVRLSRPGETETLGIKVPVIFEHSPYRYNIGGGENHNVDFSVLPQEGIQPHDAARAASAAASVDAADLPGSLDNYWVPRGQPRQSTPPTCPDRWTTTGCRVGTRSCWASRSALASPTGVPRSVT